MFVELISYSWTKETSCGNKCDNLTSAAGCMYYVLSGKTDSRSHHMIKSDAESGALTCCTASVNQLAHYRELPHLFTGLLVSLLLLSSLHYAPWQRAVQSQSEETNPQRLVALTLMKETLKSVISPISRLIKLCNRREFERIIWRGAAHSPLFPFLIPFLSGKFC